MTATIKAPTRRGAGAKKSDSAFSLTSLDSDLEVSEDDLFGSSQRALLKVDSAEIAGVAVPVISGELWTSGQRQASSIHEVSYRACFKPQLPRYFLSRFTRPGDWVYDPFSGRGTTAIESALLRRRVMANDANPLSAILAAPRLDPPSLNQVATRLTKLPAAGKARAELDLSMFYHPSTEREIVSLREYLIERNESGAEDSIDRWIRMVATNRLTGHSPGFFSVYSFPPNQAVSAEAQEKINRARNQKPPYRNTAELILKKTKQLLSSLTESDIASLRKASETAQFLNCDARRTSEIPAESIQLTVTSPPFLDIVQYAEDNWLRCWFNKLTISEVSGRITMARNVESWSETMGDVLGELFRVTRAGGVVAFEVGEVRNGKVRLEEYVVPLGIRAGFRCEAILINSQTFTKTANIWGVTNNRAGTNTNRIVVFHRPR